VNNGSKPLKYNWSFTDRDVREVTLYSPFASARTIRAGEPVDIKAEGVQILIEK
jgi:hypothetical protein